MKWQTLAKKIGSNMKQHRRQKGLTQEVAADKANLSVRYWQQLESAQKNMTLKSLVTISKALEVSVIDLFR